MPLAVVGSNQVISLPLTTVTLNGSLSTGTIVSYAWVKTAGGAATITSPSSAITTVTGLAQGTYVFTLTVVDNVSASSTTSIIITVNGVLVPYTPHASDFNTFTSDYDKVNWIDTDSWSKKKIYNQNYWLVLTQEKFAIKFGNSKPNLIVFLRQGGEQFGDAITPLNMSDFTVIFKCYDVNDELIISSPASITNIGHGQVEYSFAELDFYYKGSFYGEFDFIDGDGNIFTLPDSSKRIQIIVY